MKIISKVEEIKKPNKQRVETITIDDATVDKVLNLIGVVATQTDWKQLIKCLKIIIGE